VELVQAKICVPDLNDAQAQKEVLDALQRLPGVQSVTTLQKEIHVIYDPLQTSEKELEAAAGRSGHPASGGEAERDSPFAS
jgi:hypothetical protein